MPTWWRDLLFLAIDISGYKDTPAAIVLAIGVIITLIWWQGRQWLQKVLQKYSKTRKKWTTTTPNIVAAVLTLALLITLQVYQASRIQIEVQEAYKQHNGNDYWGVFLLVNVHNISQELTVPEDFKLRLMDGDTLVSESYTSHLAKNSWFQIWPDDFPGDRTFAISFDEILENRLAEKPVATGVPVNGWLIFGLNGVRTAKHPLLYLDFHDSFGKSASIQIKMPTIIPSIPIDARMHRGVPFPFKEKALLPLPESKKRL